MIAPSEEEATSYSETSIFLHSGHPRKLRPRHRVLLGGLFPGSIKGNISHQGTTSRDLPESGICLSAWAITFSTAILTYFLYYPETLQASCCRLQRVLKPAGGWDSQPSAHSSSLGPQAPRSQSSFIPLPRCSLSPGQGMCLFISFRRTGRRRGEGRRKEEEAFLISSQACCLLNPSANVDTVASKPTAWIPQINVLPHNRNRLNSPPKLQAMTLFSGSSGFDFTVVLSCRSQRLSGHRHTGGAFPSDLTAPLTTHPGL